MLAIATQKGGVGKTTTAVNLAVALAKYQDKKVLLVDLDGQCHVARSLGSLSTDGSHRSLSDSLLAGGRDLMEIVRPTDIPRLYVTPSDKNLSTAEALLTSRIGREFLLREALKEPRRSFDLIILDCPPNLGNLTINALVAADYVLVPCDMSMLALHGVEEVLDLVATVKARLDHEVGVLGILPTRVDKRNAKLVELVLGELDSRYRELVFRTRIPVNSAVARAQAVGKSVFDFDERAKAAVAYRDLALEVLDRLEQNGPAAR